MSVIILGAVSFIIATAVALVGYQLREMISEIKASIKELYDSRNNDRVSMAALRTDFEKLLVEHKMTHRWDGGDRRRTDGDY